MNSKVRVIRWVVAVIGFTLLGSGITILITQPHLIHDISNSFRKDTPQEVQQVANYVDGMLKDYPDATYFHVAKNDTTTRIAVGNSAHDNKAVNLPLKDIRVRVMHNDTHAPGTYTIYANYINDTNPDKIMVYQSWLKDR